MKPVRRCKPCWNGDCPDCTKWVDKTSQCQHICEAMPRQLALPWVPQGGIPLPRASDTRTQDT